MLTSKASCTRQYRIAREADLPCIDLNSFYSQQLPEAVNSSFTTVLINGEQLSANHATSLRTVSGGVNNQTLDEAGDEANLDTQFAFGIAFPTPATFFSTGGSPPFIPDVGTPTDTNEPYTAVR